MSIVSRKQKKDPEKAATPQSSDVSKEEDSLSVKSLKEKVKSLEENWMEQLKNFQSDLEIVQMREKQAEFGDSNAGAFFDAIFNNKIEQNNAEEDNQNEATP